MAMKSLFIMNTQGEVIIEKHWRGLIPRLITEFFWAEVSKFPSYAEVLPVISHQKYYLLNVQHQGLFFLAVVQNETPPLFVFDFLYRVIEIFQSYFVSVSEDTLKENFTTVYQLLDEVMDNGIPFSTELNTLQDMIHQKGLLGGVTDVIDKIPGAIIPAPIGVKVSSQLPESSTAVVHWRRVGVKHTPNEIYLDIIEEIDTIIDNNQMPVNTEVSSSILVNCKLSGMPDLTLIFNNPRIMDDASFHPCVRLNKWEQSRVISFIPPDGQFELMKYRVLGQIQLPIFCKPQITYSETGGKVTVMVGQKPISKTVEGIIITIPFPKSVQTCNLTANVGHVAYDDSNKICKWDIGKIPKDSPILSGNIVFQPGSPIPEAKPTLMVDFKINMFAVSGLKVESLAMVNEAYKPWKGVRSITKAGKFQVRS